MIFAAPQLQEKCQQMLTHFYSTLVDLTKDFDMVNRDRRWKIMQKLVGPERFTQMIDSLLNRACSHLAVEHTVDIVGCVGRTAIKAGPLSR
nr:unnamed protein product [Spirometra erinaceieuropaei]